MKKTSSSNNEELSALKSRAPEAICEGSEESPELGNKHGSVFICVSLNVVAPACQKTESATLKLV